MIFKNGIHSLGKSKQKNLNPISSSKFHCWNKIRIPSNKEYAFTYFLETDPSNIKSNFNINSLLFEFRFNMLRP